MEGVAQPSGTVTLVFTDIEGSTRLLTELHLDAMGFARQIGPLPINRALGALGWNEVLSEDYGRGRETLGELLGRVSPSDTAERLNTSINLGWADLFFGDLDEARAHLGQGLRLAWETRDRRAVAEALSRSRPFELTSLVEQRDSGAPRTRLSPSAMGSPTRWSCAASNAGSSLSGPSTAQTSSSGPRSASTRRSSSR
jgi:hypothetical protein